MWGEQLIKSWFSTFRAKDKQPTERVKKTILYSSRGNYYVINLVNCNKSITFAHQKGWFRSSVGLEQQPSKLWVLGSNPNGITKKGCNCTPFLVYIQIVTLLLRLSLYYTHVFVFAVDLVVGFFSVVYNHKIYRCF